MLLKSDPAHCFMPYPAVEVPAAAVGPLADLSFAVKDLFDVAGYPTSGGNPHVLARSGIKTQTAPTVQKLLDAGARFVGKTITDELAFSMTGSNAHFGMPRNGGAPDRIPGGSSSGSSSAVSNGLCDFALGTDTGGSVRAPANHNGLFGLRPTHGRISLQGCLDLAPSLDSCGYFTRDAATFERVGSVLLGDDSCPLASDCQLLLAGDAFGLLSPEVAEVFAPVLNRLKSLAGVLKPVDVANSSFDELYWSFRYVQGFEAWRTDGELIETFNLQLGPGVKERFAWSKEVTDAQYLEFSEVREKFAKKLNALLDQRHILVLPTMPDIAPRVDDNLDSQENYRNFSIKLLCIAGLARLPQVSVPVLTRLGAPLGLSFIGPAGSDLTLVRLAAKWAGQLV
ncbi:MAG: amidase [Betaproteobacteria bacterium]